MSISRKSITALAIIGVSTSSMLLMAPLAQAVSETSSTTTSTQQENTTTVNKDQVITAIKTINNSIKDNTITPDTIKVLKDNGYTGDLVKTLLSQDKENINYLYLVEFDLINSVAQDNVSFDKITNTLNKVVKDTNTKDLLVQDAYSLRDAIVKYSTTFNVSTTPTTSSAPTVSLYAAGDLAADSTPSYPKTNIKAGESATITQNGDSNIPDGTKFSLDPTFETPAGWDVKIDDTTGTVTVTAPADAQNISIPVIITYSDNSTNSATIELSVNGTAPSDNPSDNPTTPNNPNDTTTNPSDNPSSSPTSPTTSKPQDTTSNNPTHSLTTTSKRGPKPTTSAPDTNSNNTPVNTPAPSTTAPANTGSKGSQSSFQTSSITGLEPQRADYTGTFSGGVSSSVEGGDTTDNPSVDTGGQVRTTMLNKIKSIF